MRVHPRNIRTAGGCCLIPTAMIFVIVISALFILISCTSPEEWEKEQLRRITFESPFEVGDCIVHKTSGATGIIMCVQRKTKKICVTLYGKSALIPRHPEFVWQWSEVVKSKCPHSAQPESEVNNGYRNM